MSEKPTSGKGAPTPKRRDAASNQRKRFGESADKRTERADVRRARAQARAGLLAGDERYFPTRDRGPVRAYVRNYIDSRMGAGEFFVYGAVLVMVLSLIKSATLQTIVVYGWMTMLILVVLDTFYLTFRLRRALKSRFTEGTRGAVSYGLLRALQVRPLRVPKPRVRIGGAAK